MLFYFQIHTKHKMCKKNVEVLTVKPGGSFCNLTPRTPMIDDFLAISYAGLHAS
jgi:hypothetical protein